MANFGKVAAEIGRRVWGTPANFNGSRLGSVTAHYSSTGRQPNFAALNRGRHLYFAGQPSHWAVAHISSFSKFSPPKDLAPVSIDTPKNHLLNR